MCRGLRLIELSDFKVRRDRIERTLHLGTIHRPIVDRLRLQRRTPWSDAIQMTELGPSEQ
jgi:hypothetical protein